MKREDREARRERNKEINRFVPNTEEFRRLNRKRMVYSGVGFVGMLIAIVLSLLVPQQPFIFHRSDDRRMVVLLLRYAYRHQPAAPPA